MWLGLIIKWRKQSSTQQKHIQFVFSADTRLGCFFFFIFKKIKISKIYVHFGKFQNIPRSPYWGATGLKCNFFSFKFATKSLEEKKEGACRPPLGRPTSGPGLQAPGGPVAPPEGDRGGLSPPPHGRPGQAAYIRPPPHSLLSFDLKKSKKIQKKERGEKNASLVRDIHMYDSNSTLCTCPVNASLVRDMHTSIIQY